MPQRITFIVGAGASKELKFPVGWELKKAIERIADVRFEDGYRLKSGVPRVVEALEVMDSIRNPRARNLNNYLYAGWKIRDNMSLAASIDHFLDAHYDDEQVVNFGKIAIASAILDSERSSSLFVPPEKTNEPFDFSRVADCWHIKLAQILFSNVRKESALDAARNISFIIFNYDRAIEQFLFHAFKGYYSLSDNDAAEIVNNVEMIHPYGTVGHLPWQRQSNVVAFGAQVGGRQLVEISGAIKTFTEQVDDKEIFNKIKSVISASNSLIFLGFGFHSQNMQILKPSKQLRSCSILGTAKGISDEDVNIIKSDLNRIFKIGHNNQIIRNDLKCCELFDEYSRRFASYRRK